MTKKLKYFGTKKRSELTEFQKVSIEGYKRRFSLWQGKQLDYLTFSINLLFTICLAVAGFIVANQGECLVNERVPCCMHSSFQDILFLLVMSMTVGLIGLVCRLNDFRLTKNIVRTR